MLLPAIPAEDSVAARTRKSCHFQMTQKIQSSDIFDQRFQRYVALSRQREKGRNWPGTAFTYLISPRGNRRQKSTRNGRIELDQPSTIARELNRTLFSLSRALLEGRAGGGGGEGGMIRIAFGRVRKASSFQLFRLCYRLDFSHCRPIVTV